MSVSKLVKDNKCIVTFYPEYCLIQDFFSKKPLEIGKEDQASIIWSMSKVIGNQLKKWIFVVSMQASSVAKSTFYPE